MGVTTAAWVIFGISIFFIIIMIYVASGGTACAGDRFYDCFENYDPLDTVYQPTITNKVYSFKTKEEKKSLSHQQKQD